MRHPRSWRLVPRLLLIGASAAALASLTSSGVPTEDAPAVAPDDVGVASSGAPRVPHDSGVRARPSQIPTAAWERMLASVGTDRNAFRVVRVRQTLASYEAHNPAHQLVTTFAQDGVRVRSARSAEDPWEWTLQLRRWGYEGGLETVERVPPVAEENRVKYSRGALTEWYVNDSRGLEQGFTVAEAPPSGDAESARRSTLVLDLATTGMMAGSGPTGESVLLVAPDGRERLRYRGLLVWDANGTVLPAAMRVVDEGIRIEVVDTAATYPITIDPFIESTILLASDTQLGDALGYAVAIDANTAVVGAGNEDGGPGDPMEDAGAAYIFERDQGGAGNWGQVKKLVASDAGAYDVFGGSVAISGDTVIVAAAGEDGGPGDPLLWAGAAYVFERNLGGAGNWGEVTKLTASDAQADDAFAWSVAISNDTAIVGAYTEDGGPGDPVLDAGAAYVFDRNSGGPDNWGEVVKLTTSDAEQADLFGSSVGISGDSAVVGAWSEDGGPGSPLINAGAAYVFERNQGGANNWGEVKKLGASDAQAFDLFGEGVAISGDVVIVGAGLEDGGPGDPQDEAGAAYIFERNQGGPAVWGEVAILTASDAQAYDRFGLAVAISGDAAIVSAHREGGGPGDPLPLAGAAYVFERYLGGADNWGEARKLRASDAQAGDNFSWSVGISGKTAIVGAPDRDGGLTLDHSGAAYIFDRATWVYVLDGFGGVHAAGTGVIPISPAPPYFGFDVARDLELLGDGAYVLDGFGGVHTAGGAPALVPAPPYFGIDAAVDLELAPGGRAYVLDSRTGVHTAGALPTSSPTLFIPAPQAHCWGWVCNPSRDLELAGTGWYMLTSFGGVLRTGGTPGPIVPPPPYFGFPIARDLEIR